jgi:hypothetical protein
MNAVKHGLSARAIVLEGEDPRQFEALRAGLERDFKPETVFEREFVERLAGLLWRLRRVPGVEAALIKARREEAYDILQSERNSEEWSEYSGRMNEEVRRRCEASLKGSFGNDTDAIHAAYLNGTYAALTENFREEFRTENTEPEELAPPKRELGTGLMLLIQDGQNGDILSKLCRYEANLMNAVNRTVQHLHFLQAKRSAVRVIEA